MVLCRDAGSQPIPQTSESRRSRLLGNGVRMLGEAELYAGAQLAWLWLNFVGLIGFGAFVALAIFRRTDDPPSGKAKRLSSAPWTLLPTGRVHRSGLPGCRSARRTFAGALTRTAQAQAERHIMHDRCFVSE